MANTLETAFIFDFAVNVGLSSLRMPSDVFKKAVERFVNRDAEYVSGTRWRLLQRSYEAGSVARVPASALLTVLAVNPRTSMWLPQEFREALYSTYRRPLRCVMPRSSRSPRIWFHDRGQPHHPTLAQFMQGAQIQLIVALDGHKAHPWSPEGFGNRFRIAKSIPSVNSSMPLPYGSYNASLLAG
jgi:hypothetical protein